MIINQNIAGVSIKGVVLFGIGMRWLAVKHQNPTVVLSIGTQVFSWDVSIRELKQAWEDIMCTISVLPVYFVSDETDCDHVRVIRPHRFANRREARRYIYDSYRHAEGPVHWRRISKEEYAQMRASERMFGINQRDYGTEAFENGHPHIIIPTLTERI